MKWNFESKSEQRDYLHNHLYFAMQQFLYAHKLCSDYTSIEFC